MPTIDEDREAFRSDLEKIAPAERAALSDFIISFAKSILKTGYYESGHPEAQKSKTGLFFQLQKVLATKEYLTLTVAQFGEMETVVIGGIFDEPISLSVIMRQGGAELFIPKVKELILKNGIFSLSMIRGITEGEFSHLIDLLSRSGSIGKAGEEGAAFVATLDTLGILHAHAIPVREMRRVKRRLHWRIHVILSRMRRDLRKLPMARGLSQEELQKLYRDTVRDLFRPIRDPALVREVFLNLDAIHDEVMETVGLDPVTVAADVVPDSQLVAALGGLSGARDTSQSRGELNLTAAQLDIARQAAGLIIDRLIKGDNRDAYPILEEMFKSQAVEFERLPPRLKLRIVSERHADQFLAGKELYLRECRENIGKVEFRGNLMQPFVVVDCLMRRGSFEEALSILAVLAEMWDTHPGGDDGRFAKVFETGLSMIRNDENLAQVKKLMTSDKKETRLAAIEMTGWFGSRAVGIVLDLLRETPDKWVRKSALKSLHQLRRDALPAVLDVLMNEHETWFMKRNLLDFVGQTGGKAHAEPVEILTVHEHPRVRESALEALFALDRERAESPLLQALHDPDEGVRRKAVTLLMRHGTISPAFLSYIRETLRPDQDAKTKPSGGLRLVAVQAAAGLLQHRETRDEMEITLIAALGSGGGFLGKLVSRMSGESDDAIQAAIIDGLGRGGTARSKKVLEEFSKSSAPAVAQAAKKALADLAKRK